MSVRYQIINDEITELHKVVVHAFRLSDVDEVDLYSTIEISKWFNTDPGKFIEQYAFEKVEVHRDFNLGEYGWSFAIVATLPKKKLSEFYLKFDKPKVF